MGSDAPCKVCGYKGPGYYQRDTHPCPGNKNWKPPMAEPLSAQLERLAGDDLVARLEQLADNTGKMTWHDGVPETAADVCRAAVATVKSSLTVEHVRKPYTFDLEEIEQWAADGCPEGVSGMPQIVLSIIAALKAKEAQD